MKIFLTGGSGMVGKNILEHKSSKNYEIFSPSSQELNLLDRNAIKSMLDTIKPDMVIHAAGKVGGIQANIEAPLDFLSQNLDIGNNVISAALSAGVKNLLNLGSSCMYPREAKNPLKEQYILNGKLEPTNEGYAIAKIVSAKLCEYISNENECKNYKTIIPCNLYGRHDTYNSKKSHLIPSVISKLEDAKIKGKKSVDIWGNGTARREFMLAADLADFIYFALKRFDKMPQNLNVGLGKDYSITEYYEAIAQVIGFDGNFNYDLSKPEGMRQKLVDIQNLIDFGWQHKTELIDGITEAYSFYKEEKNNGI